MALPIMAAQMAMEGLGSVAGMVLKTITGLVSALTGGLGKLLEKFGGAILGPLKDVFNGKMLEQVMKFQQQFNKLGVRMGYSASEAKNMHEQMYKIGMNAGISAEEASKFGATLMKMKVPSERMKVLGSATAKFSRLTGVSAESAGKLVGQMAKFGASDDSIKSVVTSMAQVQRGMGLTSQGMEEVVNTSSELIGNLQSMNASSSVINGAVTTVTKLAASFEHAGLSAGKATQFVNNMMNPKNFSNNIALMNRLGVSAQQYSEIMSGNASMQGDMNKRLADMGEKIYDLMKTSPMSAEAMANAWTGGQFTAQELIKLSKNRNKKSKSEDSLQKMWGQSTQTIQDTLEKVKGIFENFWMGVVSKLLPHIETFIKTLISFVMKIDWKKISNALESLMKGMIRIFTAFLNAFGGDLSWQEFGRVVGQEIKTIMGAIMPIIDSILNQLIPQIVNGIKSFIDQFPQILAKAGIDATWIYDLKKAINVIMQMGAKGEDKKRLEAEYKELESKKLEVKSTSNEYKAMGELYEIILKEKAGVKDEKTGAIKIDEKLAAKLSNKDILDAALSKKQKYEGLSTSDLSKLKKGELVGDSKLIETSVNTALSGAGADTEWEKYVTERNMKFQQRDFSIDFSALTGGEDSKKQEAATWEFINGKLVEQKSGSIDYKKDIIRLEQEANEALIAIARELGMKDFETAKS